MKAPRRPWVRLYRDERGSFQQLPLYARALAAEILKLTDDQGVIQIGNRQPADALAFALGADRSDRRMLRKHVPMLIDDGFLRHESGRLVVQNFRKWQGGYPEDPMPEPEDAEGGAGPEPNPPTTDPGREENTTDTRPERDEATKYSATIRNHDDKEGESEYIPSLDHDAATNVQRSDHDAATTLPRTCNEGSRKPPESPPRAKSRVDKSRVEGAARAREEPNLEWERSLVVAAYQRRYEFAANDAWMGRSAAEQHIGTIAAYVRERSERHGEDPKSIAEDVVEGLFQRPDAAKYSWPLRWLAEDPGRYLRAARGGTGGKAAATEDLKQSAANANAAVQELLQKP